MRELTHKEKLVIAEFEKLRPGYGAIAEQNIRSDFTGWTEIITEMSEEEIQITQSIFKPNSFCYRHIH